MLKAFWPATEPVVGNALLTIVGNVTLRVLEPAVTLQVLMDTVMAFSVTVAKATEALLYVVVEPYPGGLAGTTSESKSWSSWMLLMVPGLTGPVLTSWAVNLAATGFGLQLPGLLRVPPAEVQLLVCTAHPVVPSGPLLPLLAWVGVAVSSTSMPGTSV